MTDRFSHLSPTIRAALDRLNDRIALAVNNSTDTAFVATSCGDVLWWTSRAGMSVGLHIKDMNGVDLTDPERVMRALPAVGRLVTEIVHVGGLRRARQEAQDVRDQAIADTIDWLNDRIALAVNNSTYTAFVVASSGDVLWWTSRPGMPVGLHITDINGVDLTNPERIMRALPAVGRLVTEIVRVWGMRRARQEAQDAHDQTIADTIDSLPITNGDDQ